MSQTEVRLVRQLSHRTYPLDSLRPPCDFCLASFGTVWTNKTAQQSRERHPTMHGAELRANATLRKRDITQAYAHSMTVAYFFWPK